jgi:hypothetical protein
MKLPAATTQMKPYFRFPFQDGESTTRFVVGCALLFGSYLIPLIPAIFVYGYTLRILRSTAEGEAPSMPAWDDWSGFFGLGLRGALVNFLFLLPGVGTLMLGIAFYCGSLFVMPFISGTKSAESGAAFALIMLAMMVMFLAMGIGSLLAMMGVLPLPAALSHLAVNGKLAAAFRVGEWWPILWANKLGYAIAFVVAAGILGVAYYGFILLYSTVVLICLAFIVLIPIFFYVELVATALFGEVYREGTAALKAAS